jgi:hypothetical protein
MPIRKRLTLPSDGSCYQVYDHRGWYVGSSRTKIGAERAARKHCGIYEELKFNDFLTPEALARLVDGTLVYRGSIDERGNRFNWRRAASDDRKQTCEK